MVRFSWHKNEPFITKDDKTFEMAAIKMPAMIKSSSVESVWTVVDYALRDLLLYLIFKHGLEEVTHPHLRSYMVHEQKVSTKQTLIVK